MIADTVVIGGQTLPVNGRRISQGCLREAGHDSRFAAQMPAGRFRSPARGVDDPHRIFHGDKLLARFLAIDFRAAQAGENERDFPGDQVRAVQLGGDVRGHPAISQGVGGVFRVRRGGQEVAAHSEEESDPTSPHLLDRFHRVGPVISRRREGKLLAEPGQERLAHPFTNSHGAVALHIGVTAHRTGARSGTPDVAAEQEKIHHLLDGGHGILMLGQSHGPATDDPLAAHGQIGCLSDLLAGQAAASQNIVPGR